MRINSRIAWVFAEFQTVNPPSTAPSLPEHTAIPNVKRPTALRCVKLVTHPQYGGIAREQHCHRVLTLGWRQGTHIPFGTKHPEGWPSSKRGQNTHQPSLLRHLIGWRVFAPSRRLSRRGARGLKIQSPGVRYNVATFAIMGIRM